MSAQAAIDAGADVNYSDKVAAASWLLLYAVMLILSCCC
jgi:hypothetical protein